VFAYDVADTRNSYIGEPTNNLKYAGDIELNDGITWTNSGTWTYSNDDTSVDKPNILGLDTQNLRIISGVTTSEGSQHIGCAYCTGLTPSTTYTISLWFRQSRAGSNQPYFRTNINNNSLGNFNYKGDTDATNWPTNQWIYITCTGTIQSNEDGIYLSNYIGSAVGDKVWYYGQQVEQKSHATPLALGTRSATQGLLPLVGNSAINLADVSFDSNAQMTFDGTNDRITLTPSNYGITNQFTIEVICNPTQVLPTGMFNFLGTVGDRGIMCHWPWNDGNIYFDVYNTSGTFHRWYKTINIVNQTALYHIMINSSGQMIVKQNNVVLSPNDASTFSGTVAIGSSNTIGAFNSSGGLPWAGNIYMFKVYNRALTDAETTQNYNKYKTRFNLS
jgi:hypothetical protein